MCDYIDMLTQMLQLTPYQSDVLKNNTDKYNMGRLVKRGGVIYVPYVSHGIYDFCINLFYGNRADLIGQNKVLVRNKRNIKFCNGGNYRVRIGQHKYYADATGDSITRDEFLQKTTC